MVGLLSTLLFTSSAAGAGSVQRPVVSELNVPSTATAGRPPRVSLRIDEAGVRTVSVKVTIRDASTRIPVIVVRTGWVHTGRTLTVRWPTRVTLTPGSYQLSLSARDHHSGTLLRGPGGSGEASLTVEAATTTPSSPSANVFIPGAAISSQIVQVAESQVGNGESPLASDCTTYGPCQPWCSLFVAWVWQHAGVPLPGATSLYGYSGSLYTWLTERGGTVLPATATPSPGDAVFYGAGPSASVHVGIVVSVSPEGQIVTVEGNYSSKVTRVGPFYPAQATRAAGEVGPVYGYGVPPSAEVTTG